MFKVQKTKNMNLNSNFGVQVYNFVRKYTSNIFENNRKDIVFPGKSNTI